MSGDKRGGSVATALIGIGLAVLSGYVVLWPCHAAWSGIAVEWCGVVAMLCDVVAVSCGLLYALTV